MSETGWLDQLPWPKIGAGLGSAILVAAGGLWGKGAVDSKIETAKAPATLQQEHISKHWDWQTSCAVVAAAPEYGTETRFCPNDDCLLYVTRRGGISSHVFQPAPQEISLPPVVLGAAEPLDPLPGVAFAAEPARCLTLEQHGPPDHPDYPYREGESLGGGWINLYGQWADNCVYRWTFHPPSRSTAGGEWVRCVH